MEYFILLILKQLNINYDNSRGILEYLGLYLDDISIRKAINLWFDNRDQCILKYGNINSWNTLSITDMSYLFYKKGIFNEDISKWCTGNVVNMNNMFGYCWEFNQPLNDWNVSNVEDMSFMFTDCYSFNQPLNKWNVENVKNTSFMFYYCQSFDQILKSWKLKNVKNCHLMFFANKIKFYYSLNIFYLFKYIISNMRNGEYF